MSRKNEIFETVLTSAYNHGVFVNFVREFLNNMELVAPTVYNKVFNNFSYYVDGYYHIGNYTGNDENKIAIFSVALKKGDSVERARTMQRNFVKPLLESSLCAGALVAFYTLEEPEKWRLSFIRLDYEFSKGKVTGKLTPAKRYSYLVGKGEPCNTAKQRLFPIFNNDENNPSIDELEEAFSVEKVTNEFFQQYCEKYHQLREFLEANDDFVQEAQHRNFTSEQFAKKLLGQIVFLYFIQKKGWLGVDAIPVVMTEKEYTKAFWARGNKSKIVMETVYSQQSDGTYRIILEKFKALTDEDEEFLAGIVKGKPWGTGPKDFMRQIFKGCVDAGKNYFDDYLEPLFYTGLNQNRGENGFYPALHRRIPFLNGGLFEQLDNYEWENNNFNIPNSIFSNVDEKGRDADGILDIFDRYNFTMNEDEPMEREVAIDPEMLGKVFENLLDVKDRKSKGAFYTPREIVHYMCQETLINHLTSKTGITETAIRDFILYGEYLRDEDTIKTLKVVDENGKLHYEFDKNKELLISEEIFSFKNGINRLQELDDLLANVKVADLAVGSGAFPLGMLNEIVKARQVLTEYLAIEMNGFQKKSFYAYERKPYDLKVNTIKNCIFACDIEPSAVDIAKLRLWLSIVIDDEITEDAGNGEFDAHSKPRQLPNLDCNIICGNSLIDEFKGIKLITDSELLHNELENKQFTLAQRGVDAMLTKLIELQDKLFLAKEHNDKEEIKAGIQRIYDDIILEQLQGNPELIDAYYETLNESSKPFVLWQLYFPRVFRDNGGFDIIIGNPPYGAKLTIEEKDYFKKKYSDVHMRTPDTYNYFISNALRLLREKAVVSFIVPNTLLFQNEYEKARKVLYKQNRLCAVINIGDNVFEKADVPTCIFVSQKVTNDSYLIKYADYRYVDNKKIHWGIYEQFIDSNVIDDTPAYVLGVDSEGNKLLKKIRENSCTIDDIAEEVAAGISTGGNEVFCIDSELIESRKFERNIIKPMLAGKNIDSYNTEWDNEFIIYSTKNSNTPQYANLYEYMLPYEEKLSKKRETKKGLIPWWSLHWPRVPSLFEGTKIIMRQTSDRIRATVDYNGYYALNSLLILKLSKTAEEEYSYLFILSILNSIINNYVYMSLTQERGRAFAEVKPKNVRKLYIPKMEKNEQKQYEDVVEKILSKQISIQNGMDIIDNLLFEHYKLSEEEIKLIRKEGE